MVRRRQAMPFTGKGGGPSTAGHTLHWEGRWSVDGRPYPHDGEQPGFARRGETRLRKRSLVSHGAVTGESPPLSLTRPRAWFRTEKPQGGGKGANGGGGTLGAGQASVQRCGESRRARLGWRVSGKPRRVTAERRGRVWPTVLYGI